MRQAKMPPRSLNAMLLLLLLLLLQVYLLLSCCPCEGRISGIVDVPNAGAGITFNSINAAACIPALRLGHLPCSRLCLVAKQVCCVKLYICSQTSTPPTEALANLLEAAVFPTLSCMHSVGGLQSAHETAWATVSV
jgi:hypothetical protein